MSIALTLDLLKPAVVVSKGNRYSFLFFACNEPRGRRQSGDSRLFLFMLQAPLLSTCGGVANLSSFGCCLLAQIIVFVR